MNPYLRHMYPKRFPAFLRAPLGTMTWRMPGARKEVFLTFDDGPTPEVTREVLKMLKEYNARATFFGIGKNADTYPELWQEVIDAGHTVGHHSYSHVNGWKVDRATYVADVHRGAEVIGGPLFRPPYGRISPRKAKILSRDYKIVMWTILSGDFDPTIDGEQCAQNVLRTLRPGDIVVFHDSVKAWPRVRIALPVILQYIREKEWVAEALPGH